MNDPLRRLSDAELEEQARITSEDIERAKASAQRHGSARFNAMLNATVVPAAPAELPSKVMPPDASDSRTLSYGEVRAALSRRAAFESHQEGVGKSPYYVLNVRPRSKSFEPFTLTGPDLTDLLREALTHLAQA